MSTIPSAMFLPLIDGGIEIGNRHHGRKASVTMVGPALLAGACRFCLAAVEWAQKRFTNTPFRFAWTTPPSGTIQAVLSVSGRTGTRLGGAWGILAPLMACTALHRSGPRTGTHLRFAEVPDEVQNALARGTKAPRNHQI